MGISHQKVAAVMEKWRIPVQRRINPNAVDYDTKIYVRPDQIDSLKGIVWSKGLSSHHEAARHVMDEALKRSA